jgi:hypothetical protein
LNSPMDPFVACSYRRLSNKTVIRRGRLEVFPNFTSRVQLHPWLDFYSLGLRPDLTVASPAQQCAADTVESTARKMIPLVVSGWRWRSALAKNIQRNRPIPMFCFSPRYCSAL